MLDAAVDLQRDIALLRRAITIGSEMLIDASEAAAISAEVASLRTALALLTERLARIQ